MLKDFRHDVLSDQGGDWSPDMKCICLCDKHQSWTPGIHFLAGRKSRMRNGKEKLDHVNCKIQAQMMDKSMQSHRLVWYGLTFFTCFLSQLQSWHCIYISIYLYQIEIYRYIYIYIHTVVTRWKFVLWENSFKRRKKRIFQSKLLVHKSYSS